MENKVYLMDEIIIEETKNDALEDLKSRYQAYVGKISGINTVKEGKEE